MKLRLPFRKNAENLTKPPAGDITSFAGALFRNRPKPPISLLETAGNLVLDHGETMKNIGYQNGLLAGYSCLSNEISPLIHKLPAKHQDQFLAAVNRALRIRAELFEAKEPTR